MANIAASFFFDHHGARVDHIPAAVVDFLCPSHDRREVESYLINQLGWVKATIGAKGVTLAFHAVMASFGALYGGHQFLGIAGVRPVHITYELDGRIHETFRDIGVARARLVEITERVAEFFNLPRFSSLEKSPSALASDDSDSGRALLSVLREWRENAGRLPADIKKN